MTADLRRMEDIMWEVMTQGPVQAVLQVHTDLFLYSSGVYSLSQEGAGRLAGHHAVKIIGWGETMGTPGARGEQYWVVTNSWGQQWGEGGSLRIRHKRHVLHDSWTSLIGQTVAAEASDWLIM